MIILIVSSVFPPEPVVSAMMSYDIAMRLCALGNKVVVVTPSPSRPLNYVFKEEKKVFPFEHIVLDSYTYPESHIIGRTRESISFGKAVARFISEYPDSIDCIYANTWPLFSQLAIARSAKKKAIPFYIHEQDVYPESYCFKIPGLLGRLLYKVLIPIDKYVQWHARGLIVISPAMIDTLSQTRKVKKEKYTLVRNWQEDQRFINAYRPVNDNDTGCHFMYLGSINPTANVTMIIEAFATITTPKCKMSIIGNGPEKSHCEEVAKVVGVDISFGSVNPDLVAEKQRSADVLVLCLKKGVAKTATPSKLTAYMLTGRPIIASVDFDSDCANIINEAKCGIVVEPDNVDALGDAMQTMANTSIEEKNIKGRKAFDYAVKHLSKEQNLKILANILMNNGIG